MNEQNFEFDVSLTVRTGEEISIDQHGINLNALKNKIDNNTGLSWIIAAGQLTGTKQMKVPANIDLDDSFTEETIISNVTLELEQQFDKIVNNCVCGGGDV